METWFREQYSIGNVYLMWHYFHFRHPHSNGPGPSDVNYFNWLVVVVQVLGVTSIIVTAIWMGHYRGGFAWQSDPKHEFNYHPLFMVTGMVFLYADGMLDVIYKTLWNTTYWTAVLWTFRDFQKSWLLPNLPITDILYGDEKQLKKFCTFHYLAQEKKNDNL